VSTFSFGLWSLECFALLTMTDRAFVFDRSFYVLFDDHLEREATSPSAKLSPASHRLKLIFVPSPMDLRSS